VPRDDKLSRLGLLHGWLISAVCEGALALPTPRSRTEAPFMSVLPPFVNCMIGRHEPKRRYVRFESNEYVGECRHCGKSIRRIARRTWRARRA